MKKQHENLKQKYNIYRLLRIAHDIKAKDLAEQLGVSPAYIHAIESGERTPSERLLQDYAAALGVDKEVLTTFQPEKYKNFSFEKVLLMLLRMICKAEGKEDV